MNISEALLSLNNYPIPSTVIDKILVDRALDGSTEYNLTISESDAFNLATADIYYWLYSCPNFAEQEINFTITDRDNFLSVANKIYLELDDPKFIGIKYGFIGEDYNG